MIHPECGGKAVKIGRNRSGSQRYKCKACGKSFSDSNRQLGRPKIGDRPLTSAERTQRSRAKLQGLLSVTKSVYNLDVNPKTNPKDVNRKRAKND